MLGQSVRLFNLTVITVECSFLQITDYVIV